MPEPSGSCRCSKYGAVRTIEINDSDATPLIGMGLLEGYELRIEAISGETVTIQSL